MSCLVDDAVLELLADALSPGRRGNVYQREGNYDVRSTRSDYLISCRSLPSRFLTRCYPPARSALFRSATILQLAFVRCATVLHLSTDIIPNQHYDWPTAPASTRQALQRVRPLPPLARPIPPLTLLLAITDCGFFLYTAGRSQAHYHRPIRSLRFDTRSDSSSSERLLCRSHPPQHRPTFFHVNG